MSDQHRPQLEIHYAEEWAALYIDGQLDPNSVGDSYIAEERAFALLGVKCVQGEAFMRGQSQRDGIAHTLDEVDEYKAIRDQAENWAANLRAQAKQLLEEADSLEA
jgi:hypothetical protein